jgi:hypothetical protein
VRRDLGPERAMGLLREGQLCDGQNSFSGDYKDAASSEVTGAFRSLHRREGRR